MLIFSLTSLSTLFSFLFQYLDQMFLVTGTPLDPKVSIGKLGILVVK